MWKMHKKRNVDCTWSSQLAYVIGLFASDGNLSPDKRHLSITSKDSDLIETTRSILKLENKIGLKSRGYTKEKKYYVLQFGDKSFYDFLLSIGLTPAKSKTLGPLYIPDAYFIDFFRGCIDGDGSINTYKHPESRQPQVRLVLCSASHTFLVWVLTCIRTLYNISGGSIHRNRENLYVLRFGKRNSLKILDIMYYTEDVPALVRKRDIALQLLGRMPRLP